MSEQPLPSLPDEPSKPFEAAPKVVRRDFIPWFFGLGLLVLAAAIFYLWQYPSSPADASADALALQAIERRIQDIDARLTRLEEHSAPDLGKINARIDALDLRVGNQAQFASQLDVLSGRIQSLSGRNQVDVEATKQQLDGLTRQMAAIRTSAGDLDSITRRLSRIAKLQEAAFALASGMPVGDLPDAPEVLARFAHSAPPTEAQLRLRFPRDEQAALSADQSVESNAPFIDRVWNRAQGLITIRQGGNVVIGNTAAITLARAQAALDAGDIAGAVNDVESLKGQPALSMENWLSEAKALLAARSALAQMAGQT